MHLKLLKTCIFNSTKASRSILCISSSRSSPRRSIYGLTDDLVRIKAAPNPSELCGKNKYFLAPQTDVLAPHAGRFGHPSGLLDDVLRSKHPRIPIPVPHALGQLNYFHMSSVPPVKSLALWMQMIGTYMLQKNVASNPTSVAKILVAIARHSERSPVFHRGFINWIQHTTFWDHWNDLIQPGLVGEKEQVDQVSQAANEGVDDGTSADGQDYQYVDLEARIDRKSQSEYNVSHDYLKPNELCIILNSCSILKIKPSQHFLNALEYSMINSIRSKFWTEKHSRLVTLTLFNLARLECQPSKSFMESVQLFLIPILFKLSSKEYCEIILGLAYGSVIPSTQLSNLDIAKLEHLGYVDGQHTGHSFLPLNILLKRLLKFLREDEFYSFSSTDMLIIMNSLLKIYHLKIMDEKCRRKRSPAAQGHDRDHKDDDDAQVKKIWNSRFTRTISCWLKQSILRKDMFSGIRFCFYMDVLVQVKENQLVSPAELSPMIEKCNEAMAGFLPNQGLHLATRLLHAAVILNFTCSGQSESKCLGDHFHRSLVHTFHMYASAADTDPVTLADFLDHMAMLNTRPTFASIQVLKARMTSWATHSSMKDLIGAMRIFRSLKDLQLDQDTARILWDRYESLVSVDIDKWTAVDFYHMILFFYERNIVKDEQAVLGMLSRIHADELSLQQISDMIAILESEHWNIPHSWIDARDKFLTRNGASKVENYIIACQSTKSCKYLTTGMAVRNILLFEYKFDEN